MGVPGGEALQQPNAGEATYLTGQMRVQDRRRQAWFWCELEAMDAIRYRVPSAQQGSARSVYVALCELAARAMDGNHDGFDATYGEVAVIAGVSERTVFRVVPLLQEVGVLVYEAGHDGRGFRAAGTWTLVTPDQTATMAERTDTEASPVAGPPRARGVGEEEEREEARASGRLFDEQAVPPADLPHMPEVMSILRDVATAKRCPRPKAESVAKVLREFPEVDHVAVARDLRFWCVDGNGARKTEKALAQRFRTFVRKAEEDRRARPVNGNGHRRPHEQRDDLMNSLLRHAGELPGEGG